jgi:geranylgeranyl diphosphate synthase type 3
MDTTKFSLTGSPSHSTSQKPSPPPTPFPLADDDSTRHVICQDSLAPWTYLLALPGKNVRDTLIDAFNDWLRCAPANLSLIKQIVGYLHTGSLIIDDIEDESATRRGEPAAHIVFGVARALNAGNYVYFLAMEKVLKLQSTECLTIFTAEMLNLHRGQGRDIFWRTTSYIASEEEYRQMVCDKTGGLFRLAIRFLQALSPLVESRMASSSSFEDEVPSTGGRHRRIVSASVFTASSDFTVLADQLACYFQVRDDLINLASPKFHMKKGFCEDITEGKLSFIALHSLRSYRATGKKAKMDELLSLLQSKSEDKKTIKRALALMDDTASFEHTVKYLKHLFADIESSIASLGRNPRLSDLLKTIAGEVDDCHDVRKRVIEAA